MRKNLFSISSKLALLVLCLFTFKTQASTPQPLTPSTFAYQSANNPSWYLGQVTFNPGWTYSSGDVLFFTPNLEPGRLSDVVIVLSATQDQTGNVYKLAIGRDNGPRTSLVYRSDYSTFLSDDSILVGTSYQGKGNADIAYKLVSGQPYWVQYLANDTSITPQLPTLTLGTGNVAGQNVVCKWKITNPIVPAPQYFGLGGWNLLVNFTNISVLRVGATPTPAPTPTPTVTPQPLTPSSFTYSSSNPDWIRGQVTFYPGWPYNPGDTLFFTATQPFGFSDVVVVFSATQDQTAPILKLAMSRGGNINSLCSNAKYDLIPGCNDITAQFQSGATYWVQLSADGATLAFGTGNTAGTNVVGSWTIPAGNQITPKYFGLGGWNQLVNFTNISVIRAGAAAIPILNPAPTPTPTAVVTTALNIPDGFTAISGNFKRISVGSAKDGLEVWAIDGNGQLFRFDPSQSNPWTAQALKDDANNVIPSLIDVAVSSLGDMVATRGNDNTAIEYDWTNKVWKKIPASNAATIKLKQIAIANSSHIYAVSEDDIIYKHTAASKDGKTAASWKKISDGIYVATGLSTTKAVIVIGVSESGSAYEFVNKKWIPLTGATNIDEVAIGNENHILGLGKDGLLWHLNHKTKKWTTVLGKDKKQASGFGSLSANAAGTIFALDTEGDVYNKGNAGVTVKTSAAGTTTLEASSAQKQAPAKVVTKKIVKKKATKKVVKKAAKPAVKKPVAPKAVK